jgi:hypothetical protein
MGALIISISNPRVGPDSRSASGKETRSLSTRLVSTTRPGPDLGHLNVELTIEDAKALTRPYTFGRVYTLAPGWELQEYVCQAVLDEVC